MLKDNSDNGIFVFDDLVPEWLYNKVLYEITSIPLTFGHRGVSNDFGYHFWSKEWLANDYNNIPWFLKSVFAALEGQKARLGNVGEIEVARCQINMTTKNLYGGTHVDVGRGVPYYTMVHFVAGDSGMDFWTDYPTNGGTIIEQVEYKDNRCVIFPSWMPHTGLPPKEIEPRVSVGYVFGGKGTEFTRSQNIGLPIWKEEQDSIFNG